MDQHKHVTIKDIAKQAGVSIATVSRVLNGQAKQYRISEKTAREVLRVTTELGYEPNQLARGLRTRQTFTIGLIIPDISNPFFATVARNIEVEARQAGYSIILCDTQEDTRLEVDSISLLKSRKVDGLIVCPTGEESDHLMSQATGGLPMVIVDRYFPAVECPSVISNNYGGAVTAVSHLIDKNHRLIGCIQGRIHTSVNRDRVQGYRDALTQHGISINESFIVGDDFGERNGYVGAKVLLNQTPGPTAIFTTSNLISHGAMRAIIEEGLSIPEDISLLSFDDQPYSEYLATPMTAVAQQTTKMGQIAAKLLMTQMREKRRGRREEVVLPTKLIIRQSVKKLAASQVRKSEQNDLTTA
ncbi:LacI family DNA-binding transcriptional regulator [Candidatus Neomarinimicrobiota bacterium]